MVTTSLPIESPSLFQRFDPRIRLLWMFLLCVVVVKYNDLLIRGLLIFSMVPIWLMARRTTGMIRFSVKMLPFIVFLIGVNLLIGWFTLKQIFTWFALEHAVSMVLVYYIMVASSSLLFQQTSFSEVMNAFRSFKLSAKYRGWNQKVESFAFVLGRSFQIVPLIQREIERLIQVQRARGIGVTEGSRFEQAKKYLQMGGPLIFRLWELARTSTFALHSYAYSSRRPRTTYKQLKFRTSDWLALTMLLGGFLLILFLPF